ncbi:putative ferric-chelate reductase 1 [Hypanus sabinus]|uniref:putative ferric-chelate reductase 1 n=1 Tax=Hypanus sabinus TaxID=79690 RepID=UPI0028C48259|nr:putative ferric-chelate reductase 1 [Hypanus sabinus]
MRCLKEACKMGGHTCSVVLFIISIFLVDVSGYPNGSVGGVCESMLPSHGTTAQTSVAPYQVIASNTTFNPGDTIQVTLKGNSGKTFKGFMLEARNAQFSSTAPLGKFITTDSQAQLLSCDVNGATYTDSAVSHVSRSEKLEIIVNWTAPNSNDIVFRATFVQSFDTFWTEVSSPIIQRSSSQNQGSNLTSTASSNLDAISSDGCGTTKFCFSNPSQCNPATDPNCYFMSSTPLDNQGLRFEMTGKASGYISIGFSDDKTMGDDDIYICGTTNSGQVDVRRAYATGRTRPSSKPLGEVDDITVANNNGIIQCSFVTRNVISTTQRAANNMYYLFFAYGTSSSGQINKHQDSPFISAEKVNVAVPQSAFGNNDRPILIKTHGALMLIAWMTTGSIGMLIARYFRCGGNTKKIFGKDLWFQLHWPLMILTVVLTIIGFVLAFVHAKGWSYGAGAHPVLGCIVMGLALIQPLVAAFRPPPDHKRRWIFKYFHSILAFAIRPITVAALFQGSLLINSAPNMWPVKVLGGFVGWELLVHILFGLIFYFGKGANCSCSDTKKVMKPFLLVFIVYLCGNLAFLVAILVGIGQA